MASCKPKYNEVFDIWKCSVCGYEHHKFFMRNCQPISTRPKKTKEYSGPVSSRTFIVHRDTPGRIFAKLIKVLSKICFWWDFSKFKSCGSCFNLEKRMDALGWKRCKDKRKTICKEILERVGPSLKYLPGKYYWIYIVFTLAIQIARVFKMIGGMKKESRYQTILKEKQEDSQLILAIESRLELRLLNEATDYLDKCRVCQHFRGTFCGRDKGEDKKDSFITRLAMGFCEKWDDKTKSSLAYKFFTNEDLVADTLSLIPHIPHDTDLIIGSSRSGLVPATVLACQLHRPLMAVGGGKVTNCGNGTRLRGFLKRVTGTQNILLVEDTSYNGTTIKSDYEAVTKTFPRARVIKLAVYVHPKSVKYVDIIGKIVAGRHYLQWNFFNSIGIGRSVFDLDGILCEDIRPEDDDDGERYLQALENAIPKYLVRKEEVPIICTARLEKYRKVTDAWLKRYGISYNKLIMGPWESQKARSAPMEISKFKAGVYSSYDYSLFVESCPMQAREITALSNKEVLCPSLKRVLTPDEHSTTIK